jgi:hypothetical protein
MRGSGGIPARGQGILRGGPRGRSSLIAMRAAAAASAARTSQGSHALGTKDEFARRKEIRDPYERKSRGPRSPLASYFPNAFRTVFSER